MHSGGVPWGAPLPHAFFPSGDHGPSPPYYPPPPAGGSHARPQPQMDAVDQRLKEAHRRRQQEYSHALAEQVRQRDERKRQEIDRRRREDAVYDSPIEAHEMGPPAARDRGLFDGLGEHNPAQRTNFGRGRRENQVAAVAPPVGMNHSMGLQQHPAQYHHVPPTDVQYPHHQQQIAWSGYAEALGFVEPSHHSGDAAHGGNPSPRRENPWSGPTTSQQPPPPPYQQPTYPQQPPQVGGRRLRTDLHTTGGTGGGPMDDAKKQLRLQQQLDMQDALRRQIEDKQRQKLEEKRKREDEERREMEKFEQDQRRQRDEQERLKEERRRNAQLEEEHSRVQQQQLAAANAAAQEQRRHHQRHHQASPSKAETATVDQHHNNPLLPLAPRNPPPTNLKNPFTNSRAYLFQDPPSPQQQQHLNQPPRPQLGNPLGPQGEHQLNIHAQGQVDYHAAATDTRYLIDQYEQVRAELERQRQLVEQLYAQMKIQQQQQRPPRGEMPRDLPTVSDLEQLRQELRDELAQREAHHREELDALRRQQEQQQHVSRVQDVSLSKPQQPASSSSRDEQPRGTRALVPVHRGPGRRHDAFVQDALQDDGYETSESLDESIGHDTRRGNQRSPVVIHKTLRGSLSAASLECESKLVFFDGRVQHPHLHKTTDHATSRNESPKQRGSTSEAPEVEESQLEDSVSNLIHHHHRTSTVGRCKQSWTQPDNQRESIAQPAHQLSERPADLGDDCDDALGFFVQRFDRKDNEPDRYRSSRLLGVCPSQLDLDHGTEHAGNGFTAVLQDIDDDDPEADSLDGDTLEAIFQRNLRRHEILLGFEAQHQNRAPQPLHWEELHRRLRNVPHEIAKHSIHTQRIKAQTEPSLAASSRWMPSSRPC
jgi:hypothetical protein